MKYRLQDLIDIEHFQELQDRLNDIYPFPSSILDNEGNILTATGWQEICTQFHRKNKDAEILCIKSDQYIKDHIQEASPTLSYRCPHGLVDNATPIIIDGVHYGNFFTGQFFLEEPNFEFFRAQAQKYDFDEEAYLRTVKKVPIWTQEQLYSYLFFIRELIAVISESGLKKLKEMENRKKIQKSEKRYRSILKAAMDGYWVTDTKGRLLEVNDAYCNMSGYSEAELLAMRIPELEIVESPELVAEHMQKVILTGSDRFESKHRRKNGTVFDVEVSVQFRKEEGGQCICFLRDITDRKKAEETLINSERKWRNILVNTPQIGIALNLKAEIVFANTHFLKLTEWEGKEVVGQNWFDMFIPEKICEEVRQVFHAVMNQKDALGFSTYENEIVTKSGEIRNVSWSNVLTKDAKGNIVDVTCLGIDLTERRRAEEELKRSEANYRMLVENQSDLVVKVDTEGRFLFVSPSYCRMFDKTESELLGKRFIPLVHEDDQEPTEKAMEALYSPPHTAYMEQRAFTKNGWRWLAWADTAVLDRDGNVKEIIGVGRDINDRKKAEESLRAAHNRFITVVDSIDANVYVVDMETYEILFMNRHMIKTFDKDLTGEKCWDVFRGESEPCQYCTNDKLVDQDQKPTDVHVWNDRNPLTGKWFINHDRAIEWTDGRLVKLQIATDITELKRMEERIREAQKMESIGNLAGGIAHDFNNILFPIVGMSEMLIEDLPPGSSERESAEEIFRAGKRGGDLVKQILTFSRQSEHKMIPTRIQNVLKEVINLSRASIPSFIEINQDIQRDCGMVMIDPSQIHQVCMNIITNAYHAVEDTGGKISIMLRQTALKDVESVDLNLSPGTYAVLSISDTGHGMSEELISKIFNPYFTTKEQGKGTGLGLAVVYGIVQEHNGDIKVNSEIGKGATFAVYLPLIEKAHGIESIDAAEDYQGGNERILLVDDEEPIANLEKQMLERMGYKVTSRFHSLDAFAAFKANPYSFDLVITDMAMPSMTGAQLSEEILALRANIPILICTGFSERIDEEKAKSTGIKGFLMKPVIKSDMAKTVRKVLDEAISENQG